MRTFDDALAMINELRKKHPLINFTIQNYHYEWKDNNNKGKSERVNTAKRSDAFRYFEFVDVTPEAKTIQFIKRTQLSRLSLNIDI